MKCIWNQWNRFEIIWNLFGIFELYLKLMKSIWNKWNLFEIIWNLIEINEIYWKSIKYIVLTSFSRGLSLVDFIDFKWFHFDLKSFEINEISRVKPISSVWNHFPGLISLISNRIEIIWNYLKSMKSMKPSCDGLETAFHWFQTISFRLEIIWNQWNLCLKPLPWVNFIDFNLVY